MGLGACVNPKPTRSKAIAQITGHEADEISGLVVLPIDPALAAVFGRWIPRRREEKRRVAVQARYGTRLGDDGKTLLPDEAELATMGLMKQWRGEGWSLKRIADELTTRKIPTKSGLTRWDNTTVHVILRRERGREVVSPPVGDDVPAKEDPGWLFPNTSGRPWSQSGSPGDAPRFGIAAAGAALNIEHLTFDSLRRFHQARAKASLGLGWEPIPPPTPAGAPAVELLPDGSCRVRGVLKVARLSGKRRRVIQALLDASEAGLTGDALRVATGLGGSVKILRALKTSDTDWDAVIHFPGRGSSCYRIAIG